ncbi:MAG: K+-dependent Na+/Ca+ exchanger related-protein [candidate division WS6 bacterium GW2011_GWF2_39_15]|uniref:K+-dependent Na+/Ca+ exchanger related-protein n=1 Tax=candidate division WS6 bacterium GW2011_GWF2_39_15 TaxID=1619100 RepID=A0A0G0MRI9_9BACT|nr:MAG: K+-dependent Na+/Ca+ exchanger related-protein [candidate division WS6 bacterium GW2011_GWF2_39_15]
MNILPSILILCVLIFLLVKSADLLESSFISVSKKLRVNTFTVGFVILAVTSSLPETFVAINSAVGNVTGLSVGNLVGATLLLLTVVIGISAIKSGGMPFKGFYGTKEILLSLGIIYAQIIALVDGNLEWLEGLLLLALYTGFVIYILGKSNSLDIHAHRKSHSVPVILMKSVLGIVGLVVTSNLTVSYAIDLAGLLSIPTIILGLLVFSVGTNLPEIIILIRSNDPEKSKLAAGNFIGSATFNTAILGLLAILRPGTVSGFVTLIPALAVLTVVIFIFAIMVISDKEISKREGLILLSLFLFYAIAEYTMNF